MGQWRGLLQRIFSAKYLAPFSSQGRAGATFALVEWVDRCVRFRNNTRALRQELMQCYLDALVQQSTRSRDFVMQPSIVLNVTPSQYLLDRITDATLA